MYCKNCGTKVTEDAKFCPNCGKSAIDVLLASEQEAADPSQTENKARPIASKVGTFCVLIILLIALITSISQNAFDPVDAVKRMTFPLLSEETPLGELAEKNFMHVKWNSEKVEDDEYTVSMTGVSNEYGEKVKINFSVYLDDEDDAVAYIDNFEIGNETFDDILSTAIIANMFIQE